MKPAIILLALTLAACEKRKPAASHIPREQAVKLAREAAQDAFAQLTSELAKAIESGGPVTAIPICSEKTRPLVEDVAPPGGSLGCAASATVRATSNNRQAGRISRPSMRFGPLSETEHPLNPQWMKCRMATLS